MKKIWSLCVLKGMPRLMLLSGAITLAGACTSGSSDSSPPSAITNRSTQIPAEKVLLLRLGSDALLKNAVLSDGIPVIDEEHKARVTGEQDKMIRMLGEKSPEIRVLWRYRYVLNALAVVIPGSMEEEIRALEGVRGSHEDLPFGRPKAVHSKFAGSGDPFQETSVSFIGARRVWESLQAEGSDGQPVPVNGSGIKVGIVDTGIDYTHKMLGGGGNPLDYSRIEPSGDAGAFFPNRKVVGGIDLVGSEYDAGSHEFSKRIPVPDHNPLDEGGHGTHVAGTVAGTGDGENTYTGVAPGASLYAIKVFGREGSTTDSVVIAALEYAVDPTGTDSPENRLDVVNLSLGSSFGLPHILYDQAISNLIRAGITPVMSAGNSGDIPYIVGSPGASDAALSVAASVDHMDHNWKFRAVEFSLPGEEPLAVKAVEGSLTRPVAESEDVAGILVAVGLAAEDLSEEMREQLRGNIALIDRGQVSFFDKLQRVYDAGALGAVVINNRDGEPVPMGGSGRVPVPGIMITKNLGSRIKDVISSGERVSCSFGTERVIEEPWHIDSMAGFSSRGPRSLDSAIKPEVSAPGQRIISAKMGAGYMGVSLSGTSMAAPHMAGVVALLKQYRPLISESEIRSRLMNHGRLLKKKTGEFYSVARQGAGRIQAYEALTGALTADAASVSLGEHMVEVKKTVRKSLTLMNHSGESLSLSGMTQGNRGWALKVSPSAVTLAPGESRKIYVSATLEAPGPDEVAREVYGWVTLLDEAEGRQGIQIPVLGVVRKLTRLQAGVARIHGSSAGDSSQALVELDLKNPGKTGGEALLFNLLGRDKRKPGIGERGRIPDICDLESVGYRVIDQEINSRTVPVLQVAAKLYSPLTSWNHCEVSVQFDSNGDGIADQELLGTELNTLTENASVNEYFSILTNAHEMRRIRREYDHNGGNPDYTPAFTDRRKLKVYHHGTLLVLSARLDKIAVTAPGLMRMKVSSLVTSNVIGTSDDFLRDHEIRWQSVDPYPEMSPFHGFREYEYLDPGETRRITLTKGSAAGRMIAYFPRNLSSQSSLRKDNQSRIIRNTYLY